MPADIRNIERSYEKLKAHYENGGLGYDDYITAVNTLRIQDENGIYWQIRTDDGKWVRWDGSTWVTGAQPGTRSPVDAGYQASDKTAVQSSGPVGPEPGLATTRFLARLGKGMATGFVRHIPLMVGTMVLVWFINIVLLDMVKKGSVTGDPHPLIASILILPGHEAAGLMFWGLLVGLTISILSKIRHGRLPGTIKKISTTPGFIRSSFDTAGFYSVFLVLIGLFGALFIAGMVSNVLVSLQLSIFLFTTLIAQKESRMAGFLQVLGADIGKTLHTVPYTGDSGVSWSVAGMTGAFTGFFFSIMLPASQFIIPVFTGFLVLTLVIILLVRMSHNSINPGRIKD
jgi:hypothetical protein